MKRFAQVLLALVAVAALAALYVFNPRLPVPDGVIGARLYEPGRLGIVREPIALVDTSRPTPANGDFPGRPVRELNGFLWRPARQEGKPFPLVVYSHGFMSSVAEPEYLVDFLVPKGYAVVAVNYPLSHGDAPGGPTINDVINQPGDVSFVIDAMLARSASPGDSLFGLFDPSRVAAVGLSLGGLTTQLAAYHRDVRDPRLRAAASIAGPSAQLDRRFFETSDLPFMMIAGSADAIVPYHANAAPIPAKVANSLLVTLEQGSHVGFASAATTVFRWAHHPDRLVCPLLLRNLRNGSADDAPRGLQPDADLGIVAAGAAPCAMAHFERAMRPAAQQMLTRLALYAFLERVFSTDPVRRRQMAEFLATGLAAENPGVAVAPPPQNQQGPYPMTHATDPYQWLEDVTGEQALDWVRARNARTERQIEQDPAFARLRDDLLAILDSDERIPGVVKRGEYYYNFWRDRNNERGVWRRTTLDEYRKPQPKWDVLLDLDQLARDENENWVWGGADVLRPDYTRALISLSRGGADADVSREYDLVKRAFVSDGFQRPEAKGSLSWIDRDHVFVTTDFGPGSMTESGYPRIARIWQRGTPLESARTVFEGRDTDMMVGAGHDDAPGFERSFVVRYRAFYDNELFELLDDGTLVKVDVPDSARKTVHHQHLAVELREPWQVGEREYAAGSLLIADYERFKAGERDFAVLFEPTDSTALDSFGFTRNFLFTNVLEDVKNRITVWSQQDGAWRGEALIGAPAFGTVSIGAVDADESDAYFMTTTDYLTPTTLWLGTIGGQPEPLKSHPAFFDASGLAISQHFATSRDGTRIPYFMVARQDLKYDGDNPTLLYGYGGFEISLTPGYNAAVGRAWVSQGGVYVVANIRGGGEYGPRWHQAALKQNRLLAYEDFAAVAQDLIDRNVTSKRRLGIQGGSNGGLLVGNMVTRYPELFEAAVCQVPLLDMQRYHKLLAGASWMAEYGDPDDPEQWRFIQAFSPYHNLRQEARYPAVLFTTSTRDDRVHPGHARKMMARMEEYGHEALYWENIEGGHGGAATNRQAAYMQALAYTFLRQRLFAATAP